MQLTAAGAYLESPAVEGETPKVQGSVMLADGATKEEVLEKLKGDIYVKSGVWDWDKVNYFPTSPKRHRR